MKKLKRIFQWTVGILMGTYLCITLLLSLPPFQRWIGGFVAGTLSDLLSTKVEVGRVQVSFTGRLIVDDIKVWDKQEKEMLTIARTGVKVRPLKMLTGDTVRISNALLFGAHAHIYQQHPDSSLNLQFIIDAFKTEGERKPMPTISINSILVRHAEVRFDKMWKPERAGRFNPSHIGLSDLSFAAELDLVNNDSLSLEINKFNVKEKSGLTIKDTRAVLTRGHQGICLKDLHLEMPESVMDVPFLWLNLNSKQVQGTLHADLAPRNLSVFLPQLQEENGTVRVDLHLQADSSAIRAQSVNIQTSDECLKVTIPSLSVGDYRSRNPIPSFRADLQQVTVTPDILSHLQPYIPELSPKVVRLIQQLGETSLQGHLQHRQGQGQGQGSLDLHTQLGQLSIRADLKDKRLKSHLDVSEIQLGNLISALQKAEVKATGNQPLLGNTTLQADVELNLPTLRSKQPTGTVSMNIQEIEIKKYTYHNLMLNAKGRNGDYAFHVQTNDPALSLHLQAEASLRGSQPRLQGLLDIQHLRPQDMNLSLPKVKVQDLDLKMGINLAGNSLDNVIGDISIPHIILTDEKGSYTLTSLLLESLGDENLRDLRFTSPYLTADAKGNFTFRDILHYVQQTAHTWLPGVVPSAKEKPELCRAEFNVKVMDPTPVERILGVPFRLDDGALTVQVHTDSNEDLLNINMSAPSISFGGQKLSDLSLSVKSRGKTMNTDATLTRRFKSTPMKVDLHLDSKEEQLFTRINWDDIDGQVTNGSIALQGKLHQQKGKINFDGNILPTTLQINDTLWRIQETPLCFMDGALSIEDFRLSMNEGDRWLSIRGKASKSAQDTLRIGIKGIDAGYIFDLAQIKPVHLSGKITGDVIGTQLFSQPIAKGDFILPDLHCNRAPMGYCKASLAWGVKPGNLDIKGYVTDVANDSWVDINGTMHLLKDPIQNMDLSFRTQRANAAFVQHYVGSIIEDMQGRATGYARIYGPLGKIDLDGDVTVEEGALTFPSMGVRYHVVNQRMTLDPQGMHMRNITAYDPQGNPGVEGHSATIDGDITYEHFKNMRYNFNITGNNVLAYNYTDFGDMNFCGVVYGTGNIQVSGSPGNTNIDIDARPERGTWMSYKKASPETLTSTKFLTFIDHSARTEDDEEKPNEEVQPEGDLRMNFNLDITPDAEMRILMDPVTNDYISMYGTSRLRCTYYNKGSFKMYGTYRVDHGFYRMSFQDVVHKEFQFAKNGTIVFGGNPFNSNLNLQAIYTVPSVSLNDLSTRGTFSNSNVRVNCVMNLGGQAGNPQIGFDFDIPNVNEDELRMVRSLISTEEERNLQVIYLLGIGRFYTYDYTGTQPQTSAAMNGLLSSTLSGKLNNVFNTLMGGNSNWNIGANLSTGETGWSDMDVEGMLSGRLLNNRLLINGNFGYRDNPVAASNFIGDFDLQWLLNKQGNLILKAYSETNDRYFTKSALTTQGVGLLLKKDFIRWTDLFRWKKRKQTAATD